MYNGPLVQAAVNGLADSLMPGGAMPSVPAPRMQMRNDTTPTRLGEQIGRAVSRGIGK